MIFNKKKRTCPNCGNEWKQSRSKAVARKVVATFSIAYPVLRDALEECKDWCNKCWNGRIQPLTESMGLSLGLTKEQVQDATLENIKKGKAK